MIGNKIADKITSVAKKLTRELPNNETEEENVELTTHKKDTYLQKKENKLMLVPKKYV